MCPYYRVLFLAIVLMFGGFSAQAGVWDMDLPAPSEDTQWSSVKTLWEKHWDGKNIDALIAELEKIRNKNPERLEPYLWLSKAYYLKAFSQSAHRQANFKQAEAYAVKAHALNPSNPLAFKLLVETLPYCGNTAYALSRYGDWFKAQSPLPVAETLPPLTAFPRWNQFQALWNQRADIEKALAAVKLMDTYADANPANGLAQVWACRANFYVGLYYTSMGQHDAKGVERYRRGMRYGERAVRLMPHSIPAHYWYQLNIGRSIQNTSLINKARYINLLVEQLLFCVRENVLYCYSGTYQAVATMLMKGGWVAKEGMRLAGITTENIHQGIDLTEMVYPDNFYNSYIKAEILAGQGNKAEAIKILEKIESRNVDAHPLFAAENRCYVRMARQLHEELKKGQ